MNADPKLGHASFHPYPASKEEQAQIRHTLTHVERGRSLIEATAYARGRQDALREVRETGVLEQLRVAIMTYKIEQLPSCRSECEEVQAKLQKLLEEKK